MARMAARMGDLNIVPAPAPAAAPKASRAKTTVASKPGRIAAAAKKPIVISDERWGVIECACAGL